MLAHEIPTHLNARDTLLWGRTAAELTIFAGGAVSLWLTVAGWLPSPLPQPVTVCWTVLSTGALALHQPQGRRLDAWVVLYIRYLLSPRRLVYRPIGGIRA